MIMKKVDSIVNKMMEILGNDKEIQRLLFYAKENNGANPSLQQLIANKYITNYPVILEGNEKFSFISIHHDNTILQDDNIYVTTFKVSCGVSLDGWTLPNGKTRLMELSDRVEELLDGQRLCNSTGPLTLAAINSVYWNSFVTGNSLIFQLVEKGVINETVI